MGVSLSRHPHCKLILENLKIFFILDKIREEINVYKRIINMMEGG